MKPALFLFDLDGTLVDTAPDLAGAVNEMRAARGLAPMPLSVLRAPAGHGGPALLGTAFGMKPTHPQFKAMRAEFMERYAGRCTQASRPFPGIASLLEGLVENGIRCGVVTNKPHDLAQRVVEAMGLAPRLSVTLGLGAPGTALKPAPDSIRTALELTGAAPSCALYAGDSDSDARASRSVGLPFAWVSWGCQATAPEDPAPDFIAGSPDDLLAWALGMPEAHS